MKTRALAIWLGLLLSLNSTLTYADNPLPDTLERLKSSVVAVGSYLPSRSPRALFLGTGFAVGNGQSIITNAHVLSKALDSEHLEQWAIFFRQNQHETMLLARVSLIDEEHDLALLTLSDGRLPALSLGDARSVREGQQAAFTGFPIGMILGLYPVTHRSSIAAISPNVIPPVSSQHLSPHVVRRLQSPFDVFQLDGTAYPGHSGSPLFDENTGQVIGIVNKVFVQGSKENALSHPSGIAYAIPATHIQHLLAQAAP